MLLYEYYNGHCEGDRPPLSTNPMLEKSLLKKRIIIIKKKSLRNAVPMLTQN